LLEREAELDRQANVLRQLKAQLGPSAREISLQLSPASLGTIQMRLALRSGRLTATLRASEPSTLEALVNQLPELRASLESQGFEVVDFDLALLDSSARG
jgi:flagellar hook-length control protein FliK